MLEIAFISWRISDLEFSETVLLFDSGIILLVSGETTQGTVRMGVRLSLGRLNESVKSDHRVRLWSNHCGVHERTEWARRVLDAFIRSPPGPVAGASPGHHVLSGEKRIVGGELHGISPYLC